MVMVLVCLLIGGFSGVNKYVKKEVIKIGVCTYKASDTFIASIVNELEYLVKEEEKQSGKRIKLSISHAQENQMTQNEQVERYIALGYDIICINSVDRTSAAYLIDQAEQAGIPLIFFNRQPVEADMNRSERVYYIGSDPKESAKLQGELIVEAYQKAPEKIDVNQDGIIAYAMLEGEAGHQDTIIRTEYAIKTLEAHGLSLKKVVGWSANFDRKQATALVEGYFQHEKDIELILSNNDDMALGAADAMKKLGRGYGAIVGIDGTPEGRGAVDEGIMLGTVVSDQRLYAKYILKRCKQIINKSETETIPRYTWIPWSKYIQ